jgi:hypothetical protein
MTWAPIMPNNANSLGQVCQAALIAAADHVSNLSRPMPPRGTACFPTCPTAKRLDASCATLFHAHKRALMTTPSIPRTERR